MRKSLFLLFTLAAFQVMSQDVSDYGIAPGVEPTGLAVGDMAPNFTAKTSDGEVFQLSEAIRKNAVALVFYRGYWCGYCSQALESYADSLSELTDIGIQVVAVTPETYENVARTAETAGVNFTILSDLQGDIMRAYEVDFRVTDAYNQRVENSTGVPLEKINGSEDAKLPIPATFLIVRDGKNDHGTIVWRHFDPDYSKRASVAQIREALLQLY